MYEGWMIIGTQDPIGNPGAFAEIVNNPRAYAYADHAGLCWLHDCGACETASLVTPGYPYYSPISDPAPWYDANDPDSWGFLGVIGLDVVGDESSTRQAEVKMSLAGTGIIGPTYMGPRTLVVRALAIATDDCSLQYGLTWLRKQYGTTFDPCVGDTLTFYDCCPCVCQDDTPGGPCWAENYRQLKFQPSCLTGWWPEIYAEETAGPPNPSMWWPDNYAEEVQGTVTMWWPDTYAEETQGPSSIYWPDTYLELITGPPEGADEWCGWPDTYAGLKTGPPQWACCVEACVVPYLRQFHNVRVTRGPMLLNKPALNSRGAVAEIEFTVVCGDPQVRAMTTRAAHARVSGTTPVTDSPAPGLRRASPYPTIRRDQPEPSAPTTPSWVRDIIPLRRPEDQVLTGFTPRVRVRSRDLSGPVRLGLWAGEQRVGGFTIPYVAPGTSILVDGRSAWALIGGTYERLPSFVQGWDSRRPDVVELPHGLYTLTVDQHPDEAVELMVDAFASPVGAG